MSLVGLSAVLDSRRSAVRAGSVAPGASSRVLHGVLCASRSPAQFTFGGLLPGVTQQNAARTRLRHIEPRPARWSPVAAKPLRTQHLIGHGRGPLFILNHPGLAAVACEYYGLTPRTNGDRLD